MASKMPRPSTFELSPAIAAQVKQMAAGMKREEDRLRALMAPVVEQMQPLVRLMKEEARRNAEHVAFVKKHIEPIIREVTKHERQYLAQWKELQRDFQPIFAKLQRLPDTTRESAKTLAQHGWFIDPGMSPRESADLANAFSKGEEADAHAALCAFFDKRLPSAEEELCSANPQRARMIRSAFAAHKRGDFAASIPVLLAQADGICREVTGVQLYSRRKLEPLTEGVRPHVLAVLAAVIEPSPMTAGEKDRVGLTGILNRHAVMHGESTDYDTALNSSRAVSLLIFVQWALCEVLKPILDKKAAAQKKPTS